MDLCEAVIIGNLGSDPEARFTPNGANLTTFPLVANQGSGDNRTATWFRVTAWAKLADRLFEYLSKGSRVYVRGQLQLRTYDKASGEKGFSLELTARDVVFLSNNGQGKAALGVDEEDLDSIPF